LQVSFFLLEYPFVDRLYPGSLDVIEHLNTWGPTDVTHHILPTGLFRRRRKEVGNALAGAKSLLAHYGISLDSHWNGVFLKGLAHKGLHTNKYILGVAKRLADHSSSKATVLLELQRIRKEILLGIFDY
jgi:hypothetical protein